MGPLVAIPILVGVNGIVGIWTVLGVAVAYGTVNLQEQFPYISECGDKAPASCFFSQVCNNGCILALIFETLRFRGLRECTNRSLNIASFSLGIISSVGLSITGNFQVSAITSVHYIGAVLAFVVGLAYLCIQLFLLKNQILKIVGISFCSVCSVLLICLVAFHLSALFYPAAICEWTLATFFFFLYPLFVFEFADMDCSINVKTRTSTEPLDRPGALELAAPA